MIRNCIVTSCFVAALAGIASVALAQPVDIPLANAGFEEPVAAKTVGDATWSNIPGWTSTGPSDDSGVESEGSLGTTFVQDELETNIAFLQSGDGAIYQTSGHVIQSGQQFTTSFLQRNDFMATELTVRLFYDDSGTRNVFGETAIALAEVGREGPMELSSFSAAAPASAVGLPVGVEFENTSLGGSTGSWAWVDVVTLSVVPEPSAAMLVMVGAALLGLCSCRNKRQ